MANEQQFKIRTRIVATRNVKEYRETIPHLVAADDVILEVGCEWGSTTVLLAAHCSEVIGTDVSEVCVERARKKHPDLHFQVLDVFDVQAALDMGKQFTKIYIDVSGFSGYRSLLDVISLLTMYATVLCPEVIVVKSGGLKHFASLCAPWHSGRAETIAETIRRDRERRARE